MKKINCQEIVIFLLLSLLFNDFQVSAQRHCYDQNEIAVQGWTDDTHYLIKKYDPDGKMVIRKVDIKTGRSVILQQQKSEEELLAESLPSGAIIEESDVISPDKKSIIFVKENGLYCFISGEKEIRRLTTDKGAAINVRYSPDCKKIAYTKNKDLYVFDLINNKEIRLTTDASERVYNGYSSWVYMEEIFGRESKYAAFWWSPDGSKIAYLRTDESDVPIFTLNRLDEPDGIHGTIEHVPYPKPGDPNPKVKIGVADINTAETVWIKIDYSVDQYIAWPFWTPDSRKLAVQIVNRGQNDLKIILADPLTGYFTQIFNEKSSTWLGFRKDIYFMNDGSGFIIRSDRNGWENLYYYGLDGKEISQITDLDFRVTSIDRVDENPGTVYFSATGAESTDKHAFRVGLDGKNLLQITKGSGTHNVTISPEGTYFIDTWNSIRSKGSIIVLDKNGRQLKEIIKFEESINDSARNSRTELIKIMTSDGLFNMPAIITYPPDFDTLKKYPAIFIIYGGPDRKNVENKWMGDLPSWYSQNGIITFKVDHRGSGHFGRRGLDYLYHCLGKWEILDYEDAVKWLCTKPFIDSTRIGITGTSYGGYLTCLALTLGAEYWTHGFAGSSVTDFRLYDNIYTERYMSTPRDNPEGYRDGSVLTWAENYKGKLYLNHGDMDDNVHIQNTIQLISKLQDEGKSFQFMLYPDGRHGWSGAKALHSMNEAQMFWLDNFFGKKNPLY